MLIDYHLQWCTNYKILSVDTSRKSTFREIQKNPIKPNKTGRFTWRGPWFRLRYAQHTKIQLERVWIEDLVLPICLAIAGKKKAGLRSGLCGREKRYDRLARSDEHSPSLPVSGSESGHLVQVRERAKDSGVQVGQ